MPHQKSRLLSTVVKGRCFAIVFTLFSLVAFVACSSTDDAGLPNEEVPDRSGESQGDPSSEGTGSVPSEPPAEGSQNTAADTGDVPTKPPSFEDFEVGILTSEEVEDFLSLINQAYETMRSYRTSFNLFWDVSLNKIGGKEFLEQTNDLEIAEGLVVATFGRYFYEGTLLNELSIELKEEAELATFNIGPYEYFIDNELNVYFYIPSLIGQEFKFDSGQLAISAFVGSELLKGGWIRANLESDILVNEKSFSFVRTAGFDLPRLMNSDFISRSLRQAKYVGEVPIMDESIQEEVQHKLFSLEFAYSDLVTQDASAALFNIFNDDLGISDEEVLSLASDVPVILEIYLDPEGVIRRIESTLNLSLILLEYFGGLQTSETPDSSSGIKFIIGSRQDFNDVGDSALGDEFVRIANSGRLPNTTTLEGVVELVDVLS